MPRIPPLAERQARYERIKAMDADKKSLTEIGQVFNLSRERVRQILDVPPRKPGPPFNPNKVDELGDKLALWQKRRASRAARGLNTDNADKRIASLIAEIAFVTANAP